MDVAYFLVAIGSYLLLLLVNAYGFWRIAKVKGWNYSLNSESNEFLKEKILKYGLVKVQLVSFITFAGLAFLLTLIHGFLVAVITGFFLNDLIDDLRVIRYELQTLKDYSKEYVR